MRTHLFVVVCFVYGIFTFFTSHIAYGQWTLNGSNIYNTTLSTYVGIGTQTPAAKFELSQSWTDYTSSFMRLSNSSNQGQIPLDFYINGAVMGKFRVDYVGNVNIVANNPNGGGIYLYTQGDAISTAKLMVASGGNVGIGTASPGALLTVNGTAPNMRLTDAADQNNGLDIIETGSSAFIHQRYNYPLNLQPSGGNVGIGMTAPNEALQVYGKVIGGTGTVPSVRNGVFNAVGGSSVAGLQMTTNGNNYAYVSSDVNNLIFGSSVGATGSKLLLSLSAPDNSVIVNSSGNVGIGTTTPSEELEVNGNIAITPDGTSGSTRSIYTPARSIAGYGEHLNISAGNNTYTSYGPSLYGGNLILTGGTVTNGNGGYSYGGNVLIYGGGASGGNGGGNYTGNVILANNGTSPTGNVLIGKTGQANRSYRLDVSGGVRADSVIVNADGSDFVFEKNYNLSSLDKVEKYIAENKHLPEIPSAEQMQKEGMSIGEMQTKLLQKVEELTLYIIEQNKRVEKLERENAELRAKE